MATLRLRILGELGAVHVRTLLSVVQNSFEILRELDAVLSGLPKGSVEWVVTDLRTGSLDVEIESRAKQGQPNLGAAVVEAFVAGFEHIIKDGRLPSAWSLNTARRGRDLVRSVRQDGANGLVITDLKRTVELTGDAYPSLAQMVKPNRTSIGSVEGALETVSIHGRPRFVVYHARTGKAVQCRFADRETLETAKAVMGRRVNVQGRLTSNVKSEPLSLWVKRLRVLREDSELPDIQDLSGSDPDFTGGMPAEQYVRSMRGA